MTEDRKAKILEKVRALIAKAESTNFPEEAESFRAKADDLMTAYAIEAWQLASDEEDGRKPECRTFDFEWWYRNPRSDELWWLFNDVARHCRCVVATRGQSYKKMPVIGLPSDLDYFDMLFTHLMLQLAKQLEPQYESDEDLDENVYRMRMAGMGWPRIAQLLYEADVIELPRGHEGRVRYFNEDPITNSTPWRELPEETQQRMRSRLASRYRKYAQEKGLTKTYTHPGVYQRSFADGFVMEVNDRLRKMRRDQEEREADDGNSMALVIRDIRQVAHDMYNELFPPPKPNPNAKPSKAVSRELATDYGAYRDGSAAGAKADIAGKGGKGLRQTPELGR